MRFAAGAVLMTLGLAMAMSLACQPCNTTVPIERLQAFSNDEGISLRWQPVTQAAFYQIDRRLLPSGVFTALTTTTDYLYLDQSALPLSTYEYRVSGRSRQGCTLMAPAPVSATRLAGATLAKLECQQITQRWLHAEQQLWDLRWSPGGTALTGFYANGFRHFLRASDGLMLFDFFTGQTQDFLAWRFDDQQVAFAGYNQVRLLNASTGTSETVLHGSFGFVHAAAWHPAIPTQMAIAAGSFLYRWNIESNAAEAVAAHGNARMIALAWRADGRLLAGANADGVITIWDATAWQVEQQIATFAGGVKQLYWRPDQRLVALFANGHTRVYAPDDFSVEHEVIEGQLSYDGRVLANMKPNGFLAIYDARLSTAPALCTTAVEQIGPPYALYWAHHHYGLLVAGLGLAVFDVELASAD